MNLIEQELSEQIIGCCMRVHRALGPGFVEMVYEEAVAIELANGGIAVERQKVIDLFYAGSRIGEHRLDFLVASRVVLELKACKAIEDAHLAVARSYLKATRLPLALVINFAQATLAIRRVVLSSPA